MANADSPPTFEAMSETKPPFGTLSARLEERILQPLRTSAFARRTWFSITVASIVALYAGLLGWMLWRDAADPPRGAQMQETPIEVVAEMPKPPTLPVPPTTVPAALFSSTPPDPSYAAQTPATAPAVLAPIFALGFGTPFLVTNAYRLAFLQDAAANPDGGFPTPTNGLPPAAPGNTLRQDFKTNDLRNWTPTAPVLLCAGNSDPTVFYFNTQLMANYWTSVGYSGYTLLDVDSAPVAGDPYATIKNEFAAAKATLTLADGTTGMLEDYHAGLVPPFCLSAAKGFFDGY